MSRGIRGQQIADDTIEGVDIKDGSLTFDDFDSNEINWKGPVVDIASLPTSNNISGDARVVLADASLHIWNGSSWNTFTTSSYSTSSFNADLATKTTDDIAEGSTNKYFYAHDHNSIYYTETESDTRFIKSNIDNSGNILLNNGEHYSPIIKFSSLSYGDLYISSNNGQFTFGSSGGAGYFCVYDTDGKSHFFKEATFDNDVKIGTGLDSTRQLKITTTDNGQPILRLDSASGPRWSIRKKGDETGSNAGSDLYISYYDDSNVFVADVLTLKRNTGEAIFSGDISTSAGRVSVNTSGTSFPTSPGLGDECYRTDLDRWYKYNSSVWVPL